jgi:Lrp/AsnC family leucine-responsive transcriptional regulator
MAGESTVGLDSTDWQILAVLQGDGRISFAELARQVAMSPSAVTERVRRLEEAGVITGYRAVIDAERVGLGLLALVRLRYPTGNYRPFYALLDTTPEIIEAHHVTGEDCFMLKVVARSMRHLEEVTGRISGLGSVTTSVVYSSPLPARDLSLRALGEPAGPSVGLLPRVDDRSSGQPSQPDAAPRRPGQTDGTLRRPGRAQPRRSMAN